MLTTVSVKVVDATGKLALKSHRIVRYTKPGTGHPIIMCVARHKKAIPVKRIVDHETVEVDMKGVRFPLADTRTATLGELASSGAASS